MSHSTVLVIGEDPECMLAPYDEDLKIEPYRQYVDVDSPRDFWLWDSLVEDGLAETAGWPEVIEAANARYADEDDLYFFDPEIGRAYQLSTYNPKSRWDWYLLGGRWTGYFDLKAGAIGEVGEPGLMTPRAANGRVDQARKRDIDFDAMRERHAIDARKEIREVLAVLKDQPPLMPWARYRDEWSDDIEKARRAYHAQPALQALRAADRYPFGDPTEEYCLDSVEPETAYVYRASRRRSTPFAVLTDEGWAEKGRMGWWGVVHDEKDQTDWSDRVQVLIDAASDDSLFSLYDVHI